MSLLKLKSIFQEEAELRTDDFISTRVNNVNQTNFFNTPPQPTVNIATNPTDFSSAAGNNNLPFTPLNQLGDRFLDGLSWASLYNPYHSFKDDAGHKGLIPINYPNASRDNLNILDVGNDFRTAGLSQVNSLLSDASIENIDDFFTSRGVEPYIVSQIGNRETTLGGRGLPVNRMITDAIRLSKFLTSPAGLIFIGKQELLGSQGQKYKSKYNPLSTIIQAGFRAGAGPINLTDRTQPDILDLLKQDEYPDFNPNATPGPSENPATIVGNLSRGGISLQDFGDGSPLGIRSLLDTFTDNLPNAFENKSSRFTLSEDERPNFGPFRPQSSELDNLTAPAREKVDDLKQQAEKFTSDTFGFPKQKNKLDEAPKRVIAEEFPTDDIKSKDLNKSFTDGDNMTLAPMIEGNTLDLISGQTTGLNDDENTLTFDVEASKEGMPFYFKDLRDNKYIFFRAFIEGLTENISPNWTPVNYVGRSEPVYTYERGERDISFNLKLAAQTREELDKQYEKMNRLTSLAYPQYDTDEYLGGNKVRMKPPLTKFRLGELYGKSNDELLGFIKSISYTIDQTSPYETEIGKRVPHQINVALTYQVIHGTVPSLDTKFYGYTGALNG